MFYVYILYSASLNKYYIGHTSDLENRLQRHNEGTTRFTSKASDWQMIYSEKLETKGNAMKRENQIKRMKSRKYIQNLTGHLINSTPNSLDDRLNNATHKH